MYVVLSDIWTGQTVSVDLFAVETQAIAIMTSVKKNLGNSRLDQLKKWKIILQASSFGICFFLLLLA